MRPTTATRSRRTLSALLAGVAVTALAACSSVTYEPTSVPVKPTPASTSSGGSATAPAACTNATQSYAPLPSLPASASITDGTLRRVLDRGYVIAGVSADTYLFAARNPLNGQIEGFDIDIARAVAESLFGDRTKVQLRVITAADRIPALKERSVDMVVRNMSITCSRWNEIAFSAEYYRSGQKVLVSKNLPNAAQASLQSLKGKRVCAPTGTSSLDKLRTVNGPIPVTAPNHTGCLVLFQQGKADAITGDDTVLAGLAAQDPYTVVTKAPAVTVEPYGIGLNRADTYLARYLNTLLASMKADGRWKAIYDKWLARPLGPAPTPPAAVYGRG